MFKRRLLLGCIAALSVLLAGCGAIDLAGEPDVVATLPPRPTQPPVTDPTYPETPPNLTVGASIFAENCTDCHGVGGAGDGELVLTGQIPNPGDMTDWSAVAVDTPTDWYNIVTNGNIENLMPPWSGSLSDEERWSVAMYNYTRSYTAESLEMGAAVYEQNCAACHGQGGAGDGPQAIEQGIEPGNLASPVSMVTLSDDAIYTLVAEGVGEHMPAFAGELSDEEMRAVTQYARTLSLAGSSDIFEGQAVVAQAATSVPAPAATEEAAAPAVEADETAEAPPPNLEEELAAVEDGTISGAVTNETEGGTLAAGLVVELHVFNDAFEETEVLETPVEDGTFTFEDIPIDPAFTYVALVDHQGREFISQPTPGTGMIDGALSLPIIVYDPTDDPSVLSIDSMAVQVIPQEDRLQVVQFVIFNNTSDRLYSVETTDRDGEAEYESVKLSLPPGSVVGGFSNPNRYRIDQESFTVTDTQPVLPGDNHMVQLAYFIPFDRDAIIEHPLDYDFNGVFRLLVSSESLTVAGDNIQSFGPVPIGETTYFEYGGEVSLAADESIRYELTLPRGGLGSGGNQNLLAISLFVLSGVSALIAIGLFVYGRMTSNGAGGADRAIDDLVTQIAQLDNAHEAGEINHDVYQRQRAELKAKLRVLMEGDGSSQQADNA